MALVAFMGALLVIPNLPTFAIEAGAATHGLVTNCSGKVTKPGSLPYEVAHAIADEQINFAVPKTCEVISVKTPIVVSVKSLSILGPGSNVLAISGGGTSPIMDVSSGAGVTLVGLTFEHGSNSQDGGAIVNDGNAGIRSSSFLDNSAVGLGGAIFNIGKLKVKGSTFLDNSVTADSSGAAGGGAIGDMSGSLLIYSSTLSGNRAVSTGTAAFGGAIDVSGYTVDCCALGDVFSQNVAEASGDGDAFGGAVYTAGANEAVLNESTFSNNSATSNDASYGGAIDVGSTANQDGLLLVLRSTLIDNSSIGASHGSTGGGAGGAIAAYGNSELYDSSIVGNTATSNGSTGEGGLGGAVTNFDKMTVLHLTFANNTATSGDSATNDILNSGSSLSLAASIVADGDGEGCGGAITDSGYNVSDDSSCDLAGPGSISSSTVLDNTLGPPANNGGPTQTIELLSGNPAINLVAADFDCDPGSDQPIDDQRGVDWGPPPCDAGAAELSDS